MRRFSPWDSLRNFYKEWLWIMYNEGIVNVIHRRKFSKSTAMKNFAFFSLPTPSPLSLSPYPSPAWPSFFPFRLRMTSKPAANVIGFCDLCCYSSSRSTTFDIAIGKNDCWLFYFLNEEEKLWKENSRIWKLRRCLVF